MSKKPFAFICYPINLCIPFSPTTGHSVLAAKLYIPNLRLIYFSSIQKILSSIFIAILDIQEDFFAFTVLSKDALFCTSGQTFTSKSVWLLIGPHENLKSVFGLNSFFIIATISKCISTIKYWYVSQLNSCDKKYSQKPPNVIINAFGFCVVWLAGFIEKLHCSLLILQMSI